MAPIDAVELQLVQSLGVSFSTCCTSFLSQLYQEPPKIVNKEVHLEVDAVMQEEQDGAMNDIDLFTTQAENIKLKTQNEIIMAKYKESQAQIAKLKMNLAEKVSK